jgi:hypothetical protein
VKQLGYIDQLGDYQLKLLPIVMYYDDTDLMYHISFKDSTEISGYGFTIDEALIDLNNSFIGACYLLQYHDTVVASDVKQYLESIIIGKRECLKQKIKINPVWIELS